MTFMLQEGRNQQQKKEFKLFLSVTSIDLEIRDRGLKGIRG